jgi:hypothetical protein
MCGNAGLRATPAPGAAGSICRDEANGNLSRLPDHRDCRAARAAPVFTADAGVINKIFI